MRTYSIIKAKSAGFDLVKTNFNVLYDTFRLNPSNKIIVKSTLINIGNYIRSNISSDTVVSDVRFPIVKEGTVVVNDTYHADRDIHCLEVTLSVTTPLTEVLPKSSFTCNFVTDVTGNINYKSKNRTPNHHCPPVAKCNDARMNVAIGKMTYTGQTNDIRIIPTRKHGVIPIDMWDQINHLARYIRIIANYATNSKTYRSIRLIQYTDEIHTTESSGSELTCQLTFSVNYRLH